ncbi:MAG TPA: hypothetical protein VJS20_08295, partial [Gemmatimonadales bacterium]|nr:hypothetical protein [Gemmatimonadales bacterium]
MAVDSRNTVYLVGINNQGQLVVFDNRLDTRLANGFSMATVLAAPQNASIGSAQYDVAVGSDGTARVVWSQAELSRTSVFMSVKGPGGWSAPVDVTNAVGSGSLVERYTYPRIRVDANGTFHIAAILTRDIITDPPTLPPYISERTHRVVH